MAALPGMLGEVSFGAPDAPPLDWRADKEATDDEDDAPLSRNERAALVGMLGFDPAELEEEEPPPDDPIPFIRPGAPRRFDYSEIPLLQRAEIAVDTLLVEDENARQTEREAEAARQEAETAEQERLRYEAAQKAERQRAIEADETAKAREREHETLLAAIERLRPEPAQPVDLTPLLAAIKSLPAPVVQVTVPEPKAPDLEGIADTITKGMAKAVKDMAKELKPDPSGRVVKISKDRDGDYTARVE